MILKLNHYKTSLTSYVCSNMTYSKLIIKIKEWYNFTIIYVDLSYMQYCYTDMQCINHVLYADDICLMAPIAIAKQCMLDIRYNYCLVNDV